MKALALLLGVALLAGCTGLPFGGSADLTAKDAEGRALQRAREWRADAALVGLASIEAPAGSAYFRGNGSNPFGQQEPDGAIGDGRTTAWMLQFHSPSANGTFGVVVYRNGTVLSDDDRGNDDRDRAVANWNVDSPQAAQVAMQDANFSAAARAADGGIVYALGMGDDSPDPFWVLTAGSEGAQTGGFILVNARTGERLAFPGMPGFGGGFTFPPGGFGGGFSGCNAAHQFGGSVGLQEPEQQHPLEVERGCDEMEVSLQYSRNLPVESITVELLGPDGEAVAAREDPEVSEGSFDAAYDVSTGDHVLVVRASSEAGITSPMAYSVEVVVS